MIGDIIREVRKSKSMSLNDLASGVGVTASYISQLERNTVDPSISTLMKISRILDMPIHTFFNEEGREPILVKAGDRHRMELAQSSIIYDYLSPVAKEKGTKMELFLIQINPRNSDGYLQHNADQCLFIIKGSVKVFLEDSSYHLEGGDSIFIKENVPHKIYNAGSRPAVGISCFAPAIG